MAIADLIIKIINTTFKKIVFKLNNIIISIINILNIKIAELQCTFNIKSLTEEEKLYLLGEPTKFYNSG